MTTKKLNCTFYNSLAPDMGAYVRKKLKGYNLKTFKETLNEKNLVKNTEILGTFVDSKIDKKVMAGMPKLKLIVTLSTGFDHIDLKEAKKRKIPVCTVPAYGEDTVAQFALTLMLALCRKLFYSVKLVKEGTYDYHGLRGTDLKGKTVGLIGTGRIGFHLIKMLDGFGVNIIAYDAFPRKELQKEYNFKYVPTLNKLLSSSDFISIHVPLLPSTHHMINKKTIKKVRKGAYIINTSRGGIIEPEALVWGLKNGHIAGAGLDVLEDEEMIKDPGKLLYSEGKDCLIKNSLMNNIIIDHPNTIVTPHNAFNSDGAIHRIYDTTFANIEAFIKGKVQNDVTASHK